jgi:Zn-dependent peptidase ImmA (M78 family)
MKTSNEWNQLSPQNKDLIVSYQQTLPIPVGAIAKKLGIIVKKSTLPAGISGEIKEVDNICIIRVNRHDVKARQRFTLAHEIAHFLLHKHLLKDGITDDILYRSNLSDAIEAQANRLAADLIMPPNIINQALSLYKDKKDEQKYELIAKEAEVSTVALKIRLGKK